MAKLPKCFRGPYQRMDRPSKSDDIKAHICLCAHDSVDSVDMIACMPIIVRIPCMQGGSFDASELGSACHIPM